MAEAVGRRRRHPLDEALRVRRRHRTWTVVQAFLGVFPVFALVNRFHPILTDGYGRDVVPGLLPEALARHHGLVLALGLAALAASELLRRRYHARHRDEIDL